LDTNQSGKITVHDIIKLSQEMGEPLSFDEAQAVMSNGDWNLADFARLMSK
jgi:Ca2+-binding EF-hand superfamily protein